MGLTSWYVDLMAGGVDIMAGGADAIGIVTCFFWQGASPTHRWFWDP